MLYIRRPDINKIIKYWFEIIVKRDGNFTNASMPILVKNVPNDETPTNKSSAFMNIREQENSVDLE